MLMSALNSQVKTSKANATVVHNLAQITNWVKSDNINQDIMCNLVYYWDELVSAIKSDLFSVKIPVSQEEFFEHVQTVSGLPCINYRDTVFSNNSYIAPLKLCSMTSKGLTPFHVIRTWERAWYNAELNQWEKGGARLGNIYDYNTNPLLYLNFHKLPHEKVGNYEEALAYYGVELEVNNKVRDGLGDLAQAVHSDLKTTFAMLKRDSSIGANGFEIVSAPATLAYHKKAWEDFFERSAKNCSSWTTNTCGMHVHIGREAFFSPLHLGKMMAFYNAPFNRNFIVDVAGRESATYARMDADHNALQAAILKVPNSNARKYSIMNAAIKGTDDRGVDRHVAINLNRSTTVEIRIFRGNVSKIGFFKNLEFVDSVVEYSKILKYRTPTTQELALHKKRLAVGSKGQEMDMFGLDFKDYLRWVETDKFNKYPNLKIWLHKKGYLKNYKEKVATAKTPLNKRIINDDVTAVA